MREIPRKNYLLLALLVIGTVLITLFLSSVYKNHHKKTSVLYNYLSEVTLNDLDAYLIENEVAIIYLDDKYDNQYNKTEKKLKNKIIKDNNKKYFVFVDISSIDDKFVEKFNKSYNYKIQEEYPLIIVVKNKKVIKVYRGKEISKFDFGVLK